MVNHNRGTVFKPLYINISNDSPYFRCPDEELFYPFEILAFRTLKLLLFRVVAFPYNKFQFLLMCTSKHTWTIPVTFCDIFEMVTPRALGKFLLFYYNFSH